MSPYPPLSAPDSPSPLEGLEKRLVQGSRNPALGLFLETLQLDTPAEEVADQAHDVVEDVKETVTYASEDIKDEL